MKKLTLSLLVWFSAITFSQAYAYSEIPDELFVREHWISFTKSYDIETKTQKLGTLYRRFFSLLLTYDFYDTANVLTASARARFFSFGAHLDIYDQHELLLGSVEEKIFTLFPTFELYAPNGSTKLARARMNFWGTKFYVYDPATDQEMAILSRSFFRFKNDWSVKVTNRALIEQNNIDSRVLITVLSVQGEIEDWQKNRDTDENSNFAAQLRTVKGFVSSQEQPSDKALEAMAVKLENAFNKLHPMSDNTETGEARSQAFVTFCLNKVTSRDLSATDKQAIMTLLNLRLEGHK